MDVLSSLLAARRIDIPRGSEQQKKSGRYALAGTVSAVALLCCAGLFFPVSSLSRAGSGGQADGLPLCLTMREIEPEHKPPHNLSDEPDREKLLNELPSIETIVEDSPPPAPDPVPELELEPKPVPAPEPEPGPVPAKPQASRSPRDPSTQTTGVMGRAGTGGTGDIGTAGGGGIGEDMGNGNAGSEVGTGSGAGSGHEPGREEQALAAVLRAIDRYKKYPRNARRVGAEGATYLLVSIGADGRVTDCGLAKPGSHPMLDAATKMLGEKIRGLETPGKGSAFQVLVPVHYSLSEPS